MMSTQPPPLQTLLREQNSKEFWALFRCEVQHCSSLASLMQMNTIRKKALAASLYNTANTRPPLRVAMLGGMTVFPLNIALETLCEAEGQPLETMVGDFDHYVAEIHGDRLLHFAPDVTVIFPAPFCQYEGPLGAPREHQIAAAEQVADGLLQLCSLARERCGCEVVIGNFPPARYHDPGPARTRLAASEWNFRRLVNLRIGLHAPEFVHVCDLEFLATRTGTLAAYDDRSWFEAKQPYSAVLLLEIARELAHQLMSMCQPSRKVLITDLDNTLWGGVIGDDGLAGIDLGTTSARGEAFLMFQRYLLALKRRGILLAIASKNDRETALQPLREHPEMVLREADFADIRANWNPKPDNIQEIARELNLGLDSLVFVDDNPAEVDAVRQMLPEVACICLGDDVAQFVPLVADSRHFDVVTITEEDVHRSDGYAASRDRDELLASVASYEGFLESLQMEAKIRLILPVDLPRAAQLINKSNQFNLTTRRRTEAELKAFLQEHGRIGLCVRLADRFGDHGLISVILAVASGRNLEIDTWVMSCRVLQRGVESEELNELVRVAQRIGCDVIHGSYIPTAKNALVRNHYPVLGFIEISSEAAGVSFVLPVAEYRQRTSHITVVENLNGTGTDYLAIAAGL